MNRFRLLLLAPSVVMLAARAAHPDGAPALAPSAVLARYGHALATVRRPKSVSFQFTVEQLGLRTLQQTHRVYRSGPRERDETLAADGVPLPVPSIRIVENPVDRYDILAVAPRPSAYDFKFIGLRHHAYVFKTIARAAAPFSVTAVELDAATFLPAVVRFRVAGNGAHGNGELRYGRTDRYWVVRTAQITARLTNGSRAHERIAWSAYQFPASLPPSTFVIPRSTAPPASASL
ncbi:MAG: hypothetical protein GIX03_01710 [Candidatus Eremiobacteraeota bacterium]|nr:hypothetical protein [Candidatus Eremiobacteraeota bacterium]MBC5801734.1 hypothetical protein [Candidatus Eremiobacteraeota bacterium]MBC5821518.1 hypothetical protein [Candidatus Eremiobacteraeota bacterium]